MLMQVVSAQEVSALIERLRPKLVARKVSLTIKGTGHTPFAGAANIQDGITIATQGLKGIQLAENKEYVTIGAGDKWRSVYTELEKYKWWSRWQGGGMSFYSTRHGFACDSVLDFEVVLASGDIVHANAKENTDLFTFPSSTIWGGVAYYMPHSFGQLIDATTHIMLSSGYGFGYHVSTCCMYHLKEDTDAPALQRFRLLPSLIKRDSTLQTGKQMDFCYELSKFTQDGSNVSLMKELHQVWLQILGPLRQLKGFIFSFGYFPFIKALLENSKKAGDNAKAIDPADGPLAVDELLRRIKKIAAGKGLLQRYIFTNYGYHKDDVLAGHGEKRVRRMKDVSRKYDPDDILQKSVLGGFNISKS
ncbi:FAD-binding domain-containing protein [Karstenula rhodostoma CBS 690.94]|uniref:FAD-binding domain-containing protein n=1 Tax=Karstenula rhodostoma CBS 690.94 TaxID=1392251 RepID=A0A9P4U956_9PLEO|nr:FAD-binding domain-containing protein [Karstenula rhodostoma CBS 690.94]